MSTELIFGVNAQKAVMKPIMQNLKNAGHAWYEDKHETHGLYTWYARQAATKTGFTSAELSTLATAAYNARVAGQPMPAIVNGQPKPKKADAPAPQPAPQPENAAPAVPSLPGAQPENAAPAPVNAQPGALSAVLSLSVTVTVPLVEIARNPHIAGWLDNAPAGVTIVVSQ